MIKEKLERYARVLDSIRGDQDKYVWLMDFGKNSVPMEAKHKMEEFEVSNCQTATWLVPHYVEDKIYFSADSMALISKGMGWLIADVYSGASAQDSIDFDQDEFKMLKLDTLLTPGRNNGVHSMLKLIIDYAT